MSLPKAGKEHRTCMLLVLDKVLSDHVLMWKASGYLIGLARPRAAPSIEGALCYL